MIRMRTFADEDMMYCKYPAVNSVAIVMFVINVCRDLCALAIFIYTYKKEIQYAHATPRHATPRHATPRHATRVSGSTGCRTRGGELHLNLDLASGGVSVIAKTAAKLSGSGGECSERSEMSECQYFILSYPMKRCLRPTR